MRTLAKDVLSHIAAFFVAENVLSISKETLLFISISYLKMLSMMPDFMLSGMAGQTL